MMLFFVWGVNGVDVSKDAQLEQNAMLNVDAPEFYPSSFVWQSDETTNEPFALPCYDDQVRACC